MIIIVNISKKYSTTGMQEYEIRINSTVITKFKHRAEEGLLKCLQLASLAVDRLGFETKTLNLLTLLNQIKG